MDPLSAGSAVVGIVGVGFSLAKAIREIAKDYKDAADDLTNLARDIEKTLYLVSQLGKLVDDNQKTGIFSDDGVAELIGCLKSTEQVFDALVALLTKTGVPHEPGTKIKPEDLIISRSNRMKWLRQKSSVKDKQEELHKVRLEVTVILLLKDTLQANPNTSKAMQHTLTMAERDRRKKAQAHQKKHGGSAQISKPTPNARNTMTHDAVPPTSRTSVKGDQAVGAFAHRAEIPTPGPVADGPLNVAAVGSNRDDGKLGDHNTILKTAIDKEAPEQETTRRTPNNNDSVINDTKVGGSAADRSATSGTASPVKIANLDSTVVGNNPSPSPAKNPSPFTHPSEIPNQPQSSRAAVIEKFKQQIRADVIQLSDKYQAMLERAIKGLGGDESEHGVRHFLESEHAREWSSMVGDWLPGTRPEFATPVDARQIEIRPSNVPRYVSSCDQRRWFVDRM